MAPNVLKFGFDDFPKSYHVVSWAISSIVSDSISMFCTMSLGDISFKEVSASVIYPLRPTNTLVSHNCSGSIVLV